ncbi:MAG: hypothetical protein K6F34_01135 [Lachnospiraceae bacterium]|nr:hypothetical protein [Lachnospiraceae bacterium]
MKKTIWILLLSICLTVFPAFDVAAKTYDFGNGIVFDSNYYAANNPDVKAVYGTDFQVLLNHYLTAGIKEGRMPSAQTKKLIESLSKQNSLPAAQPATSLVPINQLANRKSLQKKMSNAEFQAAYNVAANVVTPLIGRSREDQLSSIATSIRSLVDSGAVQYTTSVPHYNDPYGYFVAGVGSCAGETRATGLCLNMLGIPYEHVNENQWSHQWCRVPMPDGSHWIVDAYGMYVGPEPAPYRHPYL